MPVIALIFIIAAILVFLLSAFGVPDSPRFHLVPFGLALFAAGVMFQFTLANAHLVHF